MTELHIDGKPVTLPKDVTLTLKYQNVYVTKNGVFTLDITLSLLDANNAALYKHPERLAHRAWPEGRSAQLIVDNRIALNGTEIVIGNTNKDVTIQLVSGNSELNFFLNSEKLIADLDLGEESEPTASLYQAAAGGMFPEYNFSPAMVGDTRGGYFNYSVLDDLGNPMFEIAPISLLTPQPYLLFLMERVIRALGYTITRNDMRADETFRRLFLINDQRLRKYSEMLPGWTAKAFLEECEKLMNIDFYIHWENNTVEILRHNPEGFGLHVIENPLDDFQRELTDDVNLRSYKNVRYEMPDGDYHKYQDVDPEIFAAAEIHSYPKYADLLLALSISSDGVIPQNILDAYYKSLAIFFVQETGTHYIIAQKLYRVPVGYIEMEVREQYYLMPINRFAKFTSDTDTDDYLELKFYPAEMGINTGITATGRGGHMYPLPATVAETDDRTGGKDITKLILSGVSKSTKQPKKIAMALHFGLLKSFESSDLLNDGVDYVHDNYVSKENIKPGQRLTLRLCGENGLVKKYYTGSDAFDFSKEYIIKFIPGTKMDVRYTFLINSRKFLCKELEYTVTAEGMHPVVTGTFYAEAKLYSLHLAAGTGVKDVRGEGVYKAGEVVRVEAETLSGYIWNTWIDDKDTYYPQQQFDFVMPKRDIKLIAYAA
jgi:hypothetical protein